MSSSVCYAFRTDPPLAEDAPVKGDATHEPSAATRSQATEPGDRRVNAHRAEQAPAHYGPTNQNRPAIEPPHGAPCARVPLCMWRRHGTHEPTFLMVRNPTLLHCVYMAAADTYGHDNQVSIEVKMSRSGTLVSAAPFRSYSHRQRSSAYDPL
jgi:hypothetical protein